MRASRDLASESSWWPTGSPGWLWVPETRGGSRVRLGDARLFRPGVSALITDAKFKPTDVRQYTIVRDKTQ